MTMPTTAVQTVKLPDPGFPMLTRMISDPLFPEMKPQVMGCPHCKQSISIPVPSDKEEPITWIVGKNHPLVPNMNVMRMFVDRGGVEVYSVASDGKAGMRNLVPMDSVRLIEEAMPLDVFVEEMTAAEDEGDDPDPGDPEPGDPDPNPAPPPIVAPASAS
jgi:hypothetical protein